MTNPWLGMAAAGILVVTGSVAADAANPTPGPPRIAAYVPRVVGFTPRIIDVAPTVQSNTVTVTADVLFPFGSATLSPQASAVLGHVVLRLKASGPGVVTVTGFTDDVGAPAVNAALSLARAKTVVAALKSAVGRPDLTYRPVGDGAAHPVAPNQTPTGGDDPAGRAQNRRVTVSVPH